MACSQQYSNCLKTPCWRNFVFKMTKGDTSNVGQQSAFYVDKYDRCMMSVNFV